MSTLKNRRAGITMMLALPLLFGASALAPVAAQDGEPAAIGQFTAPFEEGGASTPRCVRDADDRIVCKPATTSVVQLVDGRILYFNALEATENVGLLAANEGSPSVRDSQSRIMDLRGDAPTWTVPAHQTGDGGNSVIQEDDSGTSDPFGVAGVPGRAGDGLTGSLLAPLVGEQQPSSPPDDPQDNDGDLFCSYFAMLADGTPIAIGGTDFYNEPSLSGSSDEKTDIGLLELEGLSSTRAFDTTSDTWVRKADMKYGRWYPSTVALPDGDLTVFSGSTKLVKNTQGSQVRRTETYDAETDTWTENYVGPESENSLPLMPRLHLMPDNEIHYFGNGQMWGPFGQAIDEVTYGLLQSWDQNAKTWEMNGLASLGARSGAAETMLPLAPPYDKASVLMAGGTLGPPPGGTVATALSEIYTVDSGGTISHERTEGLDHARWFSQAVNLPDGNVMVFSGGDVDAVVAPGLEAQVPQAEMFNPATREWTPMATASRGRSYHNSAILLADGRVLVGGNSPIPALYAQHRDIRGNNDKDSSNEIYSPPYLFRGERPLISQAPAGVAYGQPFDVTVSSPSEIESVMLIRVPATTHVIQNDQRAIFLDFTQDGDMLTVQAPPSGVIAPTGQYYLFVNRATPEGPVPSVAMIAKVSETADSSPATAPLLDSTVAASNGSATPEEDTTLRLPGDQFCAGCPEGQSSNSFIDMLGNVVS